MGFGGSFILIISNNFKCIIKNQEVVDEVEVVTEEVLEPVVVVVAAVAVVEEDLSVAVAVDEEAQEVANKSLNIVTPVSITYKEKTKLS